MGHGAGLFSQPFQIRNASKVSNTPTSKGDLVDLIINKLRVLEKRWNCVPDSEVLADTATDVSNVITTSITDFKRFFILLKNENICPDLLPEVLSKINKWDVSQVTDMAEMFRDASFNSPLISWNVASVTNMESMFQDSNFNQAIGSWNVASVTSMESMFHNATHFNHPLRYWNVSQVHTFDHLFYNAENFEQSLRKWIVKQSASAASIFNEGTKQVVCDDMPASFVTAYQQCLRGLFVYYRKQSSPCTRATAVKNVHLCHELFTSYPQSSEERCEWVTNTSINEHYSGQCEVVDCKWQWSVSETLASNALDNPRPPYASPYAPPYAPPPSPPPLSPRNPCKRLVVNTHLDRKIWNDVSVYPYIPKSCADVIICHGAQIDKVACCGNYKSGLAIVFVKRM